MPRRPNNSTFDRIGPVTSIPARCLDFLTVDQIQLRARTEPVADIAALTAGLARGDEPAFRESYTLYFDRLLAYLLVVTANENAAREALQLTLLRVARYVKRFESETVFWSWLTVLARSSVSDERRRARRYWALLDRFLQQKQVNDAPGPEAGARLLELLETNLAALPEDERELIQRKYFADEPVRQIAEDQAATEKSVESRLGRIRRKLKDLILAQLKHER